MQWLRFVIIFCPLLSACAMMNNLIEKGGKLLDGSASAVKTHEVWRTLDKGSLKLQMISRKSGGNALAFSLNAIPYLTFYATEPDAQGSFSVTGVYFLAGSYGGWQEYTMNASGKGRLLRYDGAQSRDAAFSLTNDIELRDITEGKIRRDDTRLSGDRALTELKSRHERINYLVDWMHSTDRKLFETQAAFEAYWRPRLLPKNKTETAAAPVLPEPLKAAREEGALESDWEEAASWIWLRYQWETVSKELQNEVILTRVR